MQAGIDGEDADDEGVIGLSGMLRTKLPADLDETLTLGVQAHGWRPDDIHSAGVDLFRQGDYPRAVACLAWAAARSDAVGVLANYARCLARLGRLDEAEQEADALCRRYPSAAAGWQVLGEVALVGGRPRIAERAFRQAVNRDTRDAFSWRGLGQIAERDGREEATVAAFRRACALDSDDAASLSRLAFHQRMVCDWTGLAAIGRRLRHAVELGDPAVAPFDFLIEGAGAWLERRCAESRARSLEEVAARLPLPPPTERTADARDSPTSLRLGMVSHGFGDHPTTTLLAALIEALSSAGVDIHLVATHLDRGEDARRRLASAATLHDASRLAGPALAGMLRDLALDVLVDLNGHCGGYRPLEFAYRCAPVQLNWLGYPGTSGLREMDYVIADGFLVPPVLRDGFSERVAYLPRCYQPNDPTRQVGPPPSRQACGLPAGDVVFACFNASFKLDPSSMDRMFAVLDGVPGSVLWLLQGPGQSRQRLRRHAARAGIDPARLVFLPRLPHAEYLSRYRLADLFLDTGQYGAHTTASDALWAGCPVLTRPGDTLASRVAGSLNHHLGMGELNMPDDTSFVSAAIALGRDPARREACRARLALARERSPLFDMHGFARDFLGLLQRMVAHHRRGGTPANLPEAAGPGPISAT